MKLKSNCSAHWSIKVESEHLDKMTNRVEKSEDAVFIIREYENIIRTKKKNIIRIVYQQGKVFKRFKEK